MVRTRRRVVGDVDVAIFAKIFLVRYPVLAHGVKERLNMFQVSSLVVVWYEGIGMTVGADNQMPADPGDRPASSRREILFVQVSLTGSTGKFRHIVLDKATKLLRLRYSTLQIHNVYKPLNDTHPRLSLG